MNKAAMTKQILESCAEAGGGGLAGFLDTKYADKKVGGLNLGTCFALAGLAVGVTGVAGKYSAYIREAGGGASAYELGKIVAERTAKSQSTSKVAGVGALPGRSVTAQQLQQSLAALRAMG